MNIIASLGFELVRYEVAFQLVSPYDTGTHQKSQKSIKSNKTLDSYTLLFVLEPNNGKNPS